MGPSRINEILLSKLRMHFFPFKTNSIIKLSFNINKLSDFFHINIYTEIWHSYLPEGDPFRSSLDPQSPQSCHPVLFLIHLFSLHSLTSAIILFFKSDSKIFLEVQHNYIFYFVFHGMLEYREEPRSIETGGILVLVTNRAHKCLLPLFLQAPGRCLRRLVSSDIYKSSRFSLHFYTKEWKLFF